MRTGRLKSGFGMVQKSAMKLKGISVFAKAVYCLLMSYAGTDEECYPSLKTICEDLDISKPTVIKSLRELIDVGLIEANKRQTVKGEYASNVYYPLTILEEKKVVNEINHPPVNDIDNVVNEVDTTNKHLLISSFKKEAKQDETSSSFQSNLFGEEKPQEPKENSKPKDSKKIKEKEPRANYEIFVECRRIWLEEIHPKWKFGKAHGENLYQIIDRLKSKLLEVREHVSNEDVSELFKQFCLSLKGWYATQDIPVINSKFDTIFEEIKLKTHGQTTTTSKQSKYAFGKRG